MDKNLWTFIFFYGNVIILIVVFLKIIDKKRLKELLPIGLMIAVENYTLEIVGLHLGYWEYPLKNPGYPEVSIISSLIYFPLIAMIYYQYISRDKVKNVIMTIGFIVANMIIESVTLFSTNLFVYKRNMNLFAALIIYTLAYVLIVSFGRVYRRLH
ncbi:CBO0543 family protein [Sporosalibacterium faouarense]|uniref:CBO0543 family protein n=1 Tax=Sporosalibacterium faouarense TaxID=516123 RepID=UPI00141CFA38|nr:CBO0543 family protein [Sporosalibacterium faouarense]MTI49625.1 hypothetical protein [Bacillota bacterium]